MLDEIFKNKSASFDKLVKYGFKLNNGIYEYKSNILENEFVLVVYVSKDGNLSTKLFDNASGDEYVLHLMKDSVGEFVGKVKTEFEKELRNICDNCFYKDIFKSKQSKEIIGYVKNKYGDELEYIWEKFPTNAVWRRKDNKKWYGAIMILPKRKLGIDSDEIVDIIDLRADPDKIETIVDKKCFFEGYHMSKKHWITICLNDSVSTETIFDYVDKSYELAK